MSKRTKKVGISGKVRNCNHSLERFPLSPLVVLCCVLLSDR